MCGIIGYTGTANAVPKMMKGLSVLEYRGYDSVGVAAQENGGVRILKCKGRIGALEEKLRDTPIEGSHCAIGHTRWATHGGPSDENAHPHRAGKVVLVHNGIIENYKELRAGLEEKGVVFLSETDTEVAAALINDRYAALLDPVAAIREATARMKGAYAFGILFDDHVGEVWVIRRGSPLILARGKDGYYLASDLTALLPFTREYCAMREDEIAVLAPDGVYQGVLALSRMPFVDTSRIGVTGHSMGGCVGTRLLERYPGVFQKAVLSSPMLGVNLGKIPVPVAQAMLRVKGAGEKRREPMDPTARFTETEKDYDTSAANSLARYRYYLHIKQGDPRYQTCAASMGWIRESLRACTRACSKRETAKIQIPVLLCQAGRDTYVRNDAQERFAARVPGCELVRYPELRHELYVSDLREQVPYWEKIFAFLG